MAPNEVRVKLRESGIERAVEILECLHDAGEPLGIAEIAQRIGAPRSTVYNVVNRFIAANLLEDYGPRGQVFFGKTIYFYAADFMRRNDLMRRGRDEVDRIAHSTGETIELCALQENKYTVAYVKSGARMFRITSEVGMRLPIPWTASGRLLLAGMSSKEIVDLVPPEDFILADGREIAINEFCDQIVEAEEAGYCITSGLIDSLTRCLAVPIKDSAGKVVATLCAVVMINRGDDDVSALLEVLIDSARRLSLHSDARSRKAEPKIPAASNSSLA